MKYLYVLAVVILSLAVMMACSKKQEDVDQLEQEMMTPEQPADTVTEDTVSPVAMDALDGPEKGADTMAFSNRVPSSAIHRSMEGVVSLKYP